MTTLNFTAQALRAKIESGAKSRTMRPATSKRWQLVHVKYVSGLPQMLQVWWDVRNRHDEQEFLFDARLSSISTRRLGDLHDWEWEADGFDSRDEGVVWFMNMYGKTEAEVLETEVFIIVFEREVQRHVVGKLEDARRDLNDTMKTTFEMLEHFQDEPDE